MNKTKLKEYDFECIQDQEPIFVYRNKDWLLYFNTWSNITRLDRVESHERWSIAEYEWKFVPYTKDEFHLIELRLNEE